MPSGRELRAAHLDRPHPHRALTISVNQPGVGSTRRVTGRPVATGSVIEWSAWATALGGASARIATEFLNGAESATVATLLDVTDPLLHRGLIAEPEGKLQNRGILLKTLHLRHAHAVPEAKLHPAHHEEGAGGTTTAILLVVRAGLTLDDSAAGTPSGGALAAAGTAVIPTRTPGPPVLPPQAQAPPNIGPPTPPVTPHGGPHA